MITLHPPELFGGQFFANTRVIVALVDWSGHGRGRLAVLIPCYSKLLEDLFDQGFMLCPLGSQQPEMFQPWTPEVVDHLLTTVLPSYGLIAAGTYR